MWRAKWRRVACSLWLANHRRLAFDGRLALGCVCHHHLGKRDRRWVADQKRWAFFALDRHRLAFFLRLADLERVADGWLANRLWLADLARVAGCSRRAVAALVDRLADRKSVV